MLGDTQFSVFQAAYAQLGTALLEGNLDAAEHPAANLLQGLRQLPLSSAAQTALHDVAGKLRTVSTAELRRDSLELVHATAGAYIAEAGLDAYLPQADGQKLHLVLAGAREPASLPETWGPRIFREARRHWRNPVRWFQDKLFRDMLQNPTLKKQMIAFMDVATGASSGKIGDYFKQYFPKDKTQATGLLKVALWAGRLGLVSDAFLGRQIQKAIDMMAKRFLAGETTEAAIQTAQGLRKEGIETTLDVVRENVVSVKEADEYEQSVTDLIRTWSNTDVGEPLTPGGVPVRHVSLKLSALTNRFNPVAHDHVVEEVSGRLLRIFQEAKRQNDAGRPVMVNVDLEEFHVRDLSYQIFWKALSDPSLAGWDHAAVVVQAYARGSESVMMQLIDLAQRTGKKIQIRIVKGAYHKYEQIVAERRGWEQPLYLSQKETDRNFRRLARLGLLNHGRVRLAIGSHSMADIGYVQDLREALGIDKLAVEHQFLRGVGDPLARAMVKLGIPTRFYGPFGNKAKAMGYMVRRLDEVTPESAIGQTHVAGTWEEYRQRQEHHYRMSASRAARAAREKKTPEFRNEPETNFSKGSARWQMQQAIELRKKTPVRVAPMIGEETPAFDPARAKEVFSPGDLELSLGHVMPADESDVERALTSAQLGSTVLKHLPAGKMSDLMRRAAALSRERKFEIAADLVLEAGKTWEAALADVDEGIDFLEAYALDAARGERLRKGLGVGAAIAPFNYPFAIAMGEVAGQLAFGNAVILKPSDLTPMVGRHVAQVLRDAGAPKQAVQFLPGPGRLIGQKLTETPLVDCYAFTGSNLVAHDIVQRAASNPPVRGGVKVVVAETGGKNPMIIDDSADLDVAVEAVLSGAFGMAGERCSATSRVIVLDGIYDQFMERLVEGAKSLFVGDPGNPKTQVGPVIGLKQFNDIRDYIEIGKKEATLAFVPDLSHIKKWGYYIGPHIFRDVPRNARIAREEIFGPVLSAFRAKDFKEAMEIANDTSYALTAGLISRNPENISTFFRDIQAGNAYVNRAQIGARVREQPFGGTDDSGTGPKAGGLYYAGRFSALREDAPRGVVLPTLPSDAPFAPPAAGMSDGVIQNIQRAQHDWSKAPVEARLQVLRRLAKILDNDAAGASEDVQGNLRRLSGLVLSYVEEAAKISRPQVTLDIPGEINEEVYDWPLGIGMIWDESENFYDMVAATAAALVMGDAVIFRQNNASRFVQQLFALAGAPRDLVTQVAQPAQEVLAHPAVRFAVSHGGMAPEVNRIFMTAPRPPVGFRRFIGANDSPWDPAYLTRFSNARVRSERTLRHGADLHLRGVVG